MQVAVLGSEEEIGAVAAQRVARVLRRKPNAVIGLATGSSPLPLYQELIRLQQAGEISFAEAKAFCLDEYVGLPADHPEGYRNFIEREFTGQVDFAPGTVHAPNGQAADSVAAAKEYDEAIKAAGGVDIQILGIGSDGHIGFNEPGGSLTSRTHLGFLTEQTRVDNSRFFDGDINQVPTACITQGLGTIMDARELIMVVTGAGKADAVRELVEGPVSAHWPATIMQFHNEAIVLLDEAAASKLEGREHLQATWEGYLRTEWADR
ncbi:glucosamine-6-phosphate deaminase [Scrofimicrobium sp. R131]|uniref:Glucosamine-6-phosphate deaminase n=1 Tax=Scrofimicrobium appendicitidis TaxID=3079930 RepID=A0AAU7V6E8_9ACTO